MTLQCQQDMLESLRQSCDNFAAELDDVSNEYLQMLERMNRFEKLSRNHNTLIECLFEMVEKLDINPQDNSDGEENTKSVSESKPKGKCDNTLNVSFT